MAKNNGEVSKIVESERRPWEEKGYSPAQRHEMLVRRYNGLVAAVHRQNGFVDKTMESNTQLQAQVLRLNADLEAARLSNQALGAKINGAGKHLEEELMRLRALLTANNIPIGG